MACVAQAHMHEQADGFERTSKAPTRGTLGIRRGVLPTASAASRDVCTGSRTGSRTGRWSGRESKGQPQLPPWAKQHTENPAERTNQGGAKLGGFVGVAARVGEHDASGQAGNELDRVDAVLCAADAIPPGLHNHTNNQMTFTMKQAQRGRAAQRPAMEVEVLTAESRVALTTLLRASVTASQSPTPHRGKPNTNTTHRRSSTCRR